MDQFFVLTRPLYFNDECGYCHGTKTLEESTPLKSWLPDSEQLRDDSDRSKHSIKGKTIGFRTESLTPKHYDSLINHNFRRSGDFIYKNDNLRSCCVYYTIRTNYDSLTLTKELKNDLNRFNKVVGNGGNQGKVFDKDVELGKLLSSKNDSFQVKFHTGYTDEKFKLYQSYEHHIHGKKLEKTTKKSFKSFLLESPFTKSGKITCTTGEDSNPQYTIDEYGTVQLCFYFENELIAVSFLDILPTGISSIYFVYDHSFATKNKLSMGKISGLVEVLMAKKLGLKYLYLGYYINDCVKMKYKAKFGGELLNPLTFEWLTLNDESIEKIEKQVEGKFGKGNLDDETDRKLLIQEDIEYEELDGLYDSQTGNDYEIPLSIMNTSSVETVLRKLKSENLKFLIQVNQLVSIEFDRLPEYFRKVCVDVFRLLGVELIEDVVISG